LVAAFYGLKVGANSEIGTEFNKLPHQ